jgi:hypothetical protein
MIFDCASQRARSEIARRTWLRRCLGAAAALLVITWGFSKEPMTRDTREDLIRGLLKEVAVSKVPMPRGKRGLRVDVNGNLDQNNAASEIRTNGMAVRPGMPVEITKIEFKSDEVVFELNGGGKSGKKWYQHIEIGMGTQTAPIGAQEPPTLAYGSSVTVALGKSPPNLTVPQVKKILSGVLDFERHSPTVLYTPAVSPEVKEAIKKHEVVVGMDRDAVLSAKGTPDRRVREVRDGVEQEDWIYGFPPHVLFVTFDGDKVIGVKQY